MKHIISEIRNRSSLAAILLCTAMLWVPRAQAQTRDEVPFGAQLELTVRDNTGKILPDVEVIVGEGQRHLSTDANGRVRIEAAPGMMVTLYKDGYEQVKGVVGELANNPRVVMKQVPVFASDIDNLYVPFTSIRKRFDTGSAVTVSGKELEAFATGDIRNALVGMFPGLEIIENNGAPGMSAMERIGRWGAGVKVSTNLRGRSPIFMVDGIPVDIAETPLDVEQVESVTLVKDVVEKTLYGPFAANGIIYIKTRAGRHNDRMLNVGVEAGVNVIDRMPGFVDGEDYAILNNIARNNSGLDPLYSRDDIQRYAMRDPYDMFHPNVNYRDMMIRNARNYQKAYVSSGGGTDLVKYFAYLGYTGEGDVWKIGPTAQYDRLNMNSNVDVKLNSFIRARIGMFASISYRTSANYGYDSDYTSEDEATNTTLGQYEFPSAIRQMNETPAISFPVYANNDGSLSQPWYAVSDLYSQNPIGNLMHNGKYTETTRRGMVRAALDMDLSFLLKGLSAEVFGSFDATNLMRIGTAEDYDAYLIGKGWDMGGNVVPALTKSSSHTLSQMSANVKLVDYFSQRFFGSARMAYQFESGLHKANAAVTTFITRRMVKLLTEPRREVTGVFSGGYSYAGKYLFNTAMAYSGTYSLKYNRYHFSPSAGIGWIASEEDFMKGIDWLDFLKVRAQGGLLHYDGSMSANYDIDNFGWNNTGASFGPYSTNQWFGSTTSGAVHRITPSLIGNPNLTLEKRIEFSVGADLMALNRRLGVELTYYNSLSDGAVTKMENAIPLAVGIGGASPYMNFNKTRYFGYELGLSWRDKAGEFSYYVAANAAVQNSKVLRIDEFNYPYAYMSRVGYPSGAIFGLRYAGQFASDGATKTVPQLFDDELSAGDFRYVDMNGDGVVDDNDRCYIGNSAPKLFYGVHVKMKWRNIDLSIIGSGRAFYSLQLTNSYYWNGWGDTNYSNFTLRHYNDGRYPKLSYYKVNNNYKLSDFWLADGSYFKIQNVELGYSLPVARWGWNSVRGLRLYAKGSNLLTLSGIKDVDPESIGSGLTAYPLFRTWVGGVKITF